MAPPFTTVIGYGSLMSARGICRDDPLRLAGARRVQLSNARRGFGKASIHADRYAMVVEATDPSQPIRARELAAHERGALPQALALDVLTDDLPVLAAREGYSQRAIAALYELSAGSDLAVYLAGLLWECGGDVVRYRARLCDRLGYTSPHYIPHPIAIGARAAVIFLAPGPEGSGSPDVVPVRVATGVTELMDVAAVWKRRPNAAQRDYIATCLLGRAHGIRMDDLTTDVPKDLSDQIGSSVSDLENERQLFRALLK
jgi:hypothetical protein